MGFRGGSERGPIVLRVQVELAGSVPLPGLEELIRAMLGRPCPKRRAPRVRGKGCAHGAPEIPGLAEWAPAITATSWGLGCAPICEPENPDPYLLLNPW